MGRRVVAEGHLRVIERNREGNVGTVRDPSLAVVLGPVLADRDLGLVRTLWQGSRDKRVVAAAGRVFQPGPQAARVPVARAAKLLLEVAWRGGDDGVDVVSDPVRLVVVVEAHGCGGH